MDIIGCGRPHSPRASFWFAGVGPAPDWQVDGLAVRCRPLPFEALLVGFQAADDA